MANTAHASFVCGMGNPWTPSVSLNNTHYYPPVVTTTPIQIPKCDHCFCMEMPIGEGEVPHLQCCKCADWMAEKFVKAWFEILGGSSDKE